MNEAVKKILMEHVWSLATCCGKCPNVVPVGFKSVVGEKLVIANMMMQTTVENVKTTGTAAVSAFDPKTSEGYQVKGAACYLTEGPEYDVLNAAAREKFGGAVVLQGVVVVNPDQVIITTPGPDNKKQL